MRITPSLSNIRKMRWHRFFVIFPVKVADDDVRTFELVERRGTIARDGQGCWWNWEFRAIIDKRNCRWWRLWV